MIAPPPPPATAVALRSGPPRIQQRILVAVALAPLALLVLLLLVSPGFLDPFNDRRVSLAGLPLGWWLVALFAAATSLAVLVAVTVRSVFGATVFVGLAAALCLWIVILGPATVLVTIALGAAP